MTRGDAPAYLAFDLGASSGRAMVGTLRDGALDVEEVHRFATPLVERDGGLYWDAAALRAELRAGLERALSSVPRLRSVSVDSWAVDYVPVDAAGDALRDPFSYRDPRTRGRMDAALARVSAAELYARTGIQAQEFNTLYQVMADVEREPEIVARTAHRLLIADWLLFRLCGRRVAERTMASTTQLMGVRTGEWDRELIRRLGLPAGGWPEIVAPGTVLGPLLLDGEPVSGGTVVVAGCSHDTAAAVAAVPADARRGSWAYLSTGTWALLGVERAEPILTESARAANFTNEAGLDGTIRFLKNLMGMWILQECEREWRAADPAFDLGALMEDAARCPRPAARIDVDDARFGERGGMLAKIAAHCAERGVAPPASPEEVTRLVLESLAGRWGCAVRELEAVTGERIEVLHLVGGASRGDFLCRLVADACGRELVAGPVEATALGNLLVQARALGDLPAGSTIRDLVRARGDIRSFTPSHERP